MMNGGRGFTLFRSEVITRRIRFFVLGDLLIINIGKLGAFEEISSGGGTALPNKTVGFVLRPRRSGRLRRPGERLASRHRRPAREKPAESPFPLRTGSPRFRIRSPAIAHYALRITNSC